VPCLHRDEHKKTGEDWMQILSSRYFFMKIPCSIHRKQDEVCSEEGRKSRLHCYIASVSGMLKWFPGRKRFLPGLLLLAFYSQASSSGFYYGSICSVPQVSLAVCL
jgi:hypothetical protein